MPKLPYFPFYPADWVSSPRIICSTLAQQGAYIRLLCMCWLSEDCSIPADRHQLSALSGLPDSDLDGVLQFFIPCTSSTRPLSRSLTNERLLKEWKKAHWISDMRSQAGKKSGESRRTHVQHKLEQKRTIAHKSEVIIHNQNSEEIEKSARLVSTKLVKLPARQDKRRWPEDLFLTQELLTLAKTLNIDAQVEFEKAKDHCLAHDKRYANFHAFLRNWFKAEADGRFGGKKSKPTKPNANLFNRNLNNLVLD